MILQLASLPNTLHGPDDPDYKGHVPKRALFLHPDAASALLKLETDTNGLIYTDIFRSAEASLAARRTKRGVQRPGYSGHNYGFSIDIDTTSSIRRLGSKKNYIDLIEIMREHGFYCHRRDLASELSEAWHFNYLGADPTKYFAKVDQENPHTWSFAVEMRIVETYGTSFLLDLKESQAALAKLGLYRGEIDGDHGPLTREAVAAFQRTWLLEETSVLNAMTLRTLAFIAAERIS